VADSDELTESIREMTAWLRVQALPQVRATLQRTLDTPEKRKAYAATDGTKTSRDVAAVSGGSKSAVARWWVEWRGEGLVVELSGGGVRHLVSLKELGLPES
jgi:hypothetical protein